jgi:3,4-dihydroxy 2-butanone 4-phosphate synthase/GTP cyclohydrolase II
MAAQFATPEAINFMAKEGRGLICLALTAERCERLGLELMATHGKPPLGTAFTETIGAAGGGSGTSAQGRARTIQAAVAPDADPADIVVPGHISPLRARDGGVLARAGHTEASVDLARLAGLTPAGVICEVMNEDGSMARLPDLVPYCARHGLKMITVADLIAYRRRTEKLVERVVETALPTSFGEFRALGFRALLDDSHHVAMVKGEVAGRDDVLVRMHTACLTGDVFHGITCDCRARLEESMELIEREGEGVLVYLSRTGHELDALLSGPGAGSAGHDLRDYDLGLQILADLGVGAGAAAASPQPVGGVLLD